MVTFGLQGLVEGKKRENVCFYGGMALMERFMLTCWWLVGN